MALFKYILDFKKAALARLRDKRKTKRYYVGPAFPLKASINLADIDTTGRRAAEAGSGRNWGGSLFNMSNAGLSLQLPPAAVARRGEKTSVTLSIDGHEVQLPCVVAHFRTEGGTSHCGLSLKTDDPGEGKAYLQLLEAVILGSTMAPVAHESVARNPAGLRSEQYKSAHKALLTAWRDTKSGELKSFELLLGEHCLRGEAKRPTIEIFSSKADGEKTAWSAPSFAASTGVEDEELRKLFRWIALNLSRAVPTDLREMMRFFAHARGDWKAPPVKARAAPGRRKIVARGRESVINYWSFAIGYINPGEAPGRIEGCFWRKRTSATVILRPRASRSLCERRQLTLADGA